MPLKINDLKYQKLTEHDSEEKLTRVGFDVPVTLKNEFKAKVARQGKKVRDVLEAFMREYIKK